MTKRFIAAFILGASLFGITACGSAQPQPVHYEIDDDDRYDDDREDWDD